ncbi:MAG: NifB/NifX family molybdenum-iron cluster-binding protein [Ignavibacteria bacterium]|jgi:predicted Fe-Mo cluster-binding NifX family protein
MNHRLAIAIEESNNSKETVAEHFARCSKIIICELNEKKEVVKTESYFNPLNGHHGGVCQLPGYISQFDVNTIIAGGMGKKAVANFHSFNIEVITAPGLDYDTALNLFIDGKLSGYEECAGHSHEC